MKEKNPDNSQQNLLRQQLCQQRKNLPLAEQKLNAEMIMMKIMQLSWYQNASSIAFYHAINGEVDLSSLYQYSINIGKNCSLPIINDDKTLSFIKVNYHTRFKINKFGIQEPLPSIQNLIDPDKLDLIFIPLVAFDSHCNRLGMGGGYYDRTLVKTNHPYLIGVGYEFQKQPQLKINNWDIPLTAVVTAKNIYFASIPKF